MKGRLYRFTPAGGKPEHFTHDFRSATLAGAPLTLMSGLAVGDTYPAVNGTWERVA